MIYFRDIFILIYFRDISILILPDISNIDILSSYWKQGKYEISYFPRIQYETLAGVFWREQGTAIILVEDSGGSDQSRGINKSLWKRSESSPLVKADSAGNITEPK